MKTCVLCGVQLDELNRSEEHIIHNAIGGHLKSDRIYCKMCNEQFGSNQDKAFTKIFSPFVDGLNIHKDRTTKGASYTGIMFDKEGNLYTATLRDGKKVVELRDSNSKYVKYEKDKFMTLSYDFNLNSDVFKLGLSKIAFNYAIHSDLDARYLERVFDYPSRELINKPVVFPFVPMTIFDSLMEMHPVEKLFHAVRIFNCRNNLYAYVELFSTFQHYVLLSENYDFEKKGCIDTSFGNIIEKHEPLEENLLESVTPGDYKDVALICAQYNIDSNQLIDGLKKYHNYDSVDHSEQLNMFFTHIGKIAFEQNRKKPYIVGYDDLINRQFERIDFNKELNSFKGIEANCFFESFQFYTIYDDDTVNLEKYKKTLPYGSEYPIEILKTMQKGMDLSCYGHIKFHMLEDRCT